MEDTDGGLHPAVDGQSLDEEKTKIYVYTHYGKRTALPKSCRPSPGDALLFLDFVTINILRHTEGFVTINVLKTHKGVCYNKRFKDTQKGLLQ